jgi:hypothetical protein
MKVNVETLFGSQQGESILGLEDSLSLPGYKEPVALPRDSTEEAVEDQPVIRLSQRPRDVLRVLTVQPVLCIRLHRTVEKVMSMLLASPLEAAQEMQRDLLDRP